jgi:hypothetical protein
MQFRHTVGSRVVGVLSLDHNNIMGWVVNNMTQLLYLQENASLSILQKAKNRVQHSMKESCGLTIWASIMVVRIWNIQEYVISLPFYKKYCVSTGCLHVGHITCCCRGQ